MTGYGFIRSCAALQQLFDLAGLHARSVIFNSNTEFLAVLLCCHDKPPFAPLELVIEQFVQYLHQVTFITLEHQRRVNIHLNIDISVAVNLLQ